jgi:elongation factor G
MAISKPEGPRNIAIVGPYLSGKTTLLESILHATGAIGRKGSVSGRNSVGDGSAEARDRQMSTEINAATTEFMGDEFTFLDCPGSIELIQETANALIGVDAAILVAEADPAKVTAIQPWLKLLDQLDLPRFIFLNKVDRATGDVQTVIDALQEISDAPLILRQLPIIKDDIITGYVDLAQSRTYVYREGAPSERIDADANVAAALGEARFAMLEQLADFDDHLMEELLEDVEPERAEIFRDLTDNLQSGNIVSVLIGAAEHDNGVQRLLKALRHETPSSDAAAIRAGVDPSSTETVAQVLKTYNTQHGGKLSLTRIWSGMVKEGDVLSGERVGSLSRMTGQQTDKAVTVGAGQIAVFGRMEAVKTGDILTSGAAPDLLSAPTFPAVFAQAVHVENRNDEVKLSSALAKLLEEDPSVSVDHDSSTHQMLLWGQGDQHLKIAAARLKSKYGVSVELLKPKVPYKEAIRKSVSQHARHKKQSGGHGQFGDVTIEIRPLPRGSGFQFDDSITGGVVPKNYIPAVQSGVQDFLSKGPLGFPVVDLAVTLTDGKYHNVDSSEQAFKTAGRMAMSEGLPQCDPVLLEPILDVRVMVPSGFTSSVNNLISGRRGQILGFDAREGWPGWDQVTAHLPQAEAGDLIVELRSLTQGVGTFTFEFDRLQEVSGRAADQAIAAAAE